MFHKFTASSCANTEAICEHIARYFEPIALSRVSSALDGQSLLPQNAVAVTIDDGYKNFLDYGHPIFRKYHIPTTVYIVSGFSGGRLWLWFDQIEFALEHTPRRSLQVAVDGRTFEFLLGSEERNFAAHTTLVEALKVMPNHARLEFVARFGALCHVDIPAEPPTHFAAMSWNDLRAAAAEGVEIGCHTETHPILSRVSEPRELERETRGAKEVIEERLGFPVHHFCYPNGRDIDIGDAALKAVRAAGYDSAVTTTWGLNTKRSDPMSLRRVPFSETLDLRYGAELLVGLHM
jgi:peptidoglycan/xylan/chitin deacetylase (PgdA/CDA1 family)